MNAVGLIEVIGFPCAVDAADAAAKSASIKILGLSKIGSGMITVTFSGDVGAVNSAVQAGAQSAKKIGKVLYTHVIPRADNQLVEKGLLFGKDSKPTPNPLYEKTNAELRDMVIRENLTDEKQAKLLKKDELIELLKKGKETKNGANG